LELRHGACCRDSGSTQASEVVAIGAGDAFDQADDAQPVELARQRPVVQWHEGLDVGAAHAVDVELRALQGAEQDLVGSLEQIKRARVGLICASASRRATSALR